MREHGYKLFVARVPFILQLKEGVNKVRNNGRVLTIKEASKITGLSTSTLRMHLKKGLIEGVKTSTKFGDTWHIKADSIKHLKSLESSGLNAQPLSNMRTSETSTSTSIKNSDNLIRMRDEHLTDLRKQVMTYEGIIITFQQRIGVLESEKTAYEAKLKLLPAPPEILLNDLQQKEAALAQAEKIVLAAQETQKQYEEAVAQLKLKLQEEEHAKEAFRIQWELAQTELERPWWKKIFGIK